MLIVFIFVPDTNAACLLLKVVQFAAVNNPRFEALAEGKLKVCVDVAELMVKSVPVLEVAKV